MWENGKITINHIDLPRGQQKLAFVLDNVYTKEECENLIQVTEEKGYEPALVQTGRGKCEHLPDVRNNQRCMWDTTEESQKLFDRIKEFLPQVFKGRRLLGLNERLRFLRYDPGEFFAPHFDGSYVRDNGEVSFVTVHLYLNEGFKGGETTFLDSSWGDVTVDDVPIVPRTGSVLVFQHDIYHQGSALKEGRKYTVRTDAMYSAAPVE